MASYADTQVKRTINNNHEEEEEEQHFSYAMQLVTAGSLPMVLLTAFRLGLFEIISKAGPGAQLSPSQIAADLSSTNPEVAVMVDRMLRLLASHSVLTCSTVEAEAEAEAEAEGTDATAAKSGIFTRVYGLAPAGKYFVRNPELGGASLGSVLALLQDEVFNQSWYELKDAILEGGVPFNRVHGTHAFEYPGRDPRFNQVFNEAMINHTTIVISRILDSSSYKGFEQLKSLVDVGGGLGITIGRITAKYPTIKGINFDLPHVVQHAFTYPGVEHIGGDMFESVPAGEAIFMKWILHDWDDEHCLKLLKNCYTSLPDNGKVIVVDSVLSDNPDTSSSMKASCQTDLVMLTQNPGGKERSEQEFLTLATAAGFKGIKKQCFVCNLWVMEFYK